MAQDQAKSSDETGAKPASVDAASRPDDKLANSLKGRKDTQTSHAGGLAPPPGALPPAPRAAVGEPVTAPLGNATARTEAGSPKVPTAPPPPLPFPVLPAGSARTSGGPRPPPLPAGTGSAPPPPAATPSPSPIEDRGKTSSGMPRHREAGTEKTRTPSGGTLPSPPKPISQSPGPSLAAALSAAAAGDPPVPVEGAAGGSLPETGISAAGMSNANATNPNAGLAQVLSAAGAVPGRTGTAAPAIAPGPARGELNGAVPSQASAKAASQAVAQQSHSLSPRSSAGAGSQADSDAFGEDPLAEEAAAAEEEEIALRRVARRRPAGPVRGRIAANDDAPSIGGLIYALEQKPSNEIYRYAAIASAVWAALSLVLGLWSLSSEAALSSWGAILAKPTAFLTFAAIVVPIAVIWLLALLSWRAEELRLRSSTMTEVAIRLAEPDRMAEDSIASLGQAVRRQVGFMNEAIGRALGRAGELEALVHNEVAALERSYEENERRIRGLINELANERHALNSTSTSFNDTLRTLGREVPVLIERLSNQQSNLSHIIQGAGENLQQLETSLSRSVTSLHDELGGRTGELKGVLENYTGALGAALGTRTEQLDSLLAGHGQRLQAMIDDRSGRIGEALVGRTEDMHKMLEAHAGQLASAMGGRSEDMQKMLEAYTGALATALGSRTSQMQQAFAENMGRLDKAIANRTSNLQAVFEEYARALDSTLSARAGKLDKQLIERTRALDAAFDNRIRLFDEAIHKSTRAVDEAVETRAKALTSALETHARTFSDTISRQSADLDHSLNQGITAVRKTSENITRQSLKAIESLAGQSDMLKNVSENLVAQIGSLTNRFEAQGQTILKAANALESVNYKIDSTLQTRHAELSATLDRMVGKADEFTRYVQDYSTTIEGTLSEAETRALAAAEQLRIGTQARREEALDEIGRLQDEADAESARTLARLKERLSTVSAEISEQVTSQLGTLTDRFTQTSEDVRARAERVAEELAREQERMRAEAERLPQTTRETAEAMRLALQDQLRAIDQLSSLTNREAQRRDVALPIAHGGALKPAGDQRSEAPSAATKTSTPPARGFTSLGDSLARELGARGVGAGAPSTPPPPRSQPPAEAGPGPTAAAQSNWSLGDLLKRASNEDARTGLRGGPGSGPATQPARTPPAEPAPPAPVPFRLDVDVLARALDSSTAAIIWSRLRTGQRGIMARSVYAPEARAVFDELTRRYPADAGLRATIDRYITDFERILRDAEGKDGSGRLAQSHMTSTMGRVYLLLAHASGRIT